MSQLIPDDLDEELGIPNDATLVVPMPMQLTLIPQLDNLRISDFVTIASSSLSSTSGNTSGGDSSSSTNPNFLTIDISSKSSMRGQSTPRCLIIGRQASAADIRIDHKSVSRRHTALFYYNNSHSTNPKNSNGNENGKGPVLVVQDLGGKHGTYIDNTRIETNGRLELPILRDDGSDKEYYTIRIGNAPLIFRVMIIAPATEKLDDLSQQSMQHESNEMGGCREENAHDDSHPRNAVTSSNNDHDHGAKDDTDNDVPSTRESREAQIAAMVASFDADPVYTKYFPTNEGGDEGGDGEDDAVTKRMSNLATEGGGSNHAGRSDKDATNDTAKSNNNEFNLPISSSITLAPGTNSFSSSDITNTQLQAKASVTTLCFEPSGARLAAAHRDGTLRLYDFHGMHATADSENTYPPFRIVDSENDPLDNTGRHIITALAPSSTGAQWIVGTTSAQPKILDREGRSTLFHFIKGDIYVTDSSNTKGHTAGVTGVAFHPFVNETCWSCGLDGSIRQWDVSGRGKTQFNKLVCQRLIGKLKNEKGQRTQIVSNLSVHPGGRKLVVGTACGSIQIWNCFGNMVNSRPLGAVYSAHRHAKPVTFVTFSGNGERIASRSEADDTVRIWDVNRMEKGAAGSSSKKRGGGGGDHEHPPSLLLAVCNDLPALNESATCAFGPDGRILCAGTSVDPRASTNNACGQLKFYQLPEVEKRSKDSKEAKSKSSSDRKTTPHLDPIVVLNIAPNASVLGVQWHPKLNQIAFGTSNGM